MYKLEVKQAARRMIQDAYDWYEQQQPGLGEAFLSAVDNSFSKIVFHPEYFSIVNKGYRQIRLMRFPFVVVYEIIGSNVVIFAVFHTSRNRSQTDY